MSEAWVQVGRDPFARQDVERTQAGAVSFSKVGCWNCGNLNGFARLFRYRIASDGGRRSEINGKFCGIECMRAYHS
jgi:hypothetical protein